MKYRVVYDAGKPYEETYDNDEDLANALQDFYLANKDSNYPFDAVVYDENDEDITDSQFIQEIIDNISVEDVELKSLEEINNEIERMEILMKELEEIDKNNKNYWQIERCKSIINALKWVKGE